VTATDPTTAPGRPRAAAHAAGHPRYDPRAILGLAALLIFAALATGRLWHAAAITAMAIAARVLVWALTVIRDDGENRAPGQRPTRGGPRLWAAHAVFAGTGITMIVIIYVVTIGRL